MAHLILRPRQPMSAKRCNGFVFCVELTNGDGWSLLSLVAGRSAGLER
jgi:hypothetical protein